MDPCESQRKAVAELEAELHLLNRRLSRFDFLTSAPTADQTRRMTELATRRAEVERRQLTARARLRDCENAAR